MGRYGTTDSTTVSMLCGGHTKTHTSSSLCGGLFCSGLNQFKSLHNPTHLILSGTYQIQFCQDLRPQIHESSQFRNSQDILSTGSDNYLNKEMKHNYMFKTTLQADADEKGIPHKKRHSQLMNQAYVPLSNLKGKHSLDKDDCCIDIVQPRISISFKMYSGLI
uniref:Sulfatase domain-containing protein n=1 Tax=Heterorhabditis bacteriophora TaxID=37862 RepID=A0A1I7X853_HETBA